MDLLIDRLYFYSKVNLMPILSILSVLFTQDTCATGSSILTCEIRKEVFLHGYKSARALRKTNTARISKVIYVGIARKVSLFHVGTCRVLGLQNIFFYSHIHRFPFDISCLTFRQVFCSTYVNDDRLLSKLLICR